MTVAPEQIARLTRAVALINAYGAVLSEHEAQLTRDCIDRLRDRGERMVLTDNEWRVIEEAVGGMEAAREDDVRSQTHELSGRSSLSSRAQDRCVKGAA